jgi:creatinine amidohydrolase
MRINDMHWQQVEQYLRHDDRAVLPIGSTEQHAYLRMGTDSILAERVAVEAAEPLGIPVFPVLSYGITPYFMAFPGTVSLRIETFLAVLKDVLDAIASHGFRRILLVNGHGGNSPAQGFAAEWMMSHPDVRVRFHNWYNAPATWKKVQEIDKVGGHASWMENFPWTRVPNVAQPNGPKKMIDMERARMLNPAQMRDYLGDGNYGGAYQHADEEMLVLWEAGVAETRAILRDGWG